MKKGTKIETGGNEGIQGLSVRMDKLVEVVISIGDQVSSIQTDLRTKYATKDDLIKLKEELLSEIRPIARAVDKDALTLIKHEKRITRIEKHMVLV